MKIPFVLLLIFVAHSNGFAQQASYFDPAQAYNRLLIEKNNGVYKQISNYKVVGSSYLYGEKNGGHMFAKEEQAFNIFLSYDTYTQNIEFYSSANPDKPLVKEPGDLDSFVIKKSPANGLENNISFIYGSFLGARDKAFYQVVTRGEKLSLYKKYTCELGLVTTNYIQSELRQFNIVVDYFYTDSTGKKIKKLKISPEQLTKEFTLLKDLSSVINGDALHYAKEAELIRIFSELNR
jgi:hypothetical protein